MNYARTHIIFLYSLFLTLPLFSQVTFSPAFGSLTFPSPVFLTNPPDGTNRIFVVEQQGIITVFNNDSNASSFNVFLNVSNKIVSGGEQGLLGLAFHPSYSTNRFFYIYYTRISDGALIISRFTTQAANPSKADSLSELILLTVPHPTFTNHNGGCLMFGSDGYLYIGMGDGGSGGDPNNNAQNVNEMLGKIHRIDVNNPSGGNNYGIPPGNPFAITGGRKEIFSWGVRNPWRFTRDPVTNKLYLADVGQGLWEEIDTLSVGKNYGWRCYEGNHPYNLSGCGSIETYTFPIKEYDHSGGNCSITGGYVYRGSRVPWLVGRYVYGDYCSRKVWKLLYSAGNVSDTSLIGLAPSLILSFGVDMNNEQYVCCANGIIYRFNDNVIGGGGNNELVPTGFFLEQNYPNPFNPVTSIKFDIPSSSYVEIVIYDAAGNEINTLVKEIKSPGRYEVNWNAANYPSGVYYCTLITDKGIMDSRKIALVK
jgi:glucose/arabinose dehydrogenase